MKAICNSNTVAALGKIAIKIGNSVESQFDLEIGKQYIVYGIVDFQHALHYLTIGESDYPTWYPVELFTILDPVLPQRWFFTYVGEEDGVIAVWGYEELANYPSHYEELLERGDKAINIFVKRKINAE